MLTKQYLWQKWIGTSRMVSHTRQNSEPDNKVHGASMVLSAPDGPHVGPMNFAIWASRFGAGKFVNGRLIPGAGA